jgi:hypothetical protein
VNPSLPPPSARALRARNGRLSVGRRWGHFKRPHRGQFRCPHSTSASARSPGSSHSKVVDLKVSQDDPSPSLQPHYRAFIATTRRSAPVPRITTLPLTDQLLGVLANAHSRRPILAPLAARARGATGSPVPHRSPDQARATSTPDTAWPIGRHPPGSSQGSGSTPVLMSSFPFRRVISGSLSFAFLTRTWRTHGAPFPTTLTTTALDRSSSGRFAASACTTTAEGHQPTGQLLHLRCSTTSRIPISYIATPSTFVFTQPD